jgi:hypothetical protein
MLPRYDHGRCERSPVRQSPPIYRPEARSGRAGPARPWPSDPARVVANCPWRVGPGWRIPCPAVPHEHHLGLHACTVLDFVPCAVLLAISYIVVVSHNRRRDKFHDLILCLDGRFDNNAQTTGVGKQTSIVFYYMIYLSRPMIFVCSWISTILRVVLIIGLEIAKPIIKRLVVVYPTEPPLPTVAHNKGSVGHGFWSLLSYACY